MLRQNVSTPELAERIDKSYLWLQRRLNGTTPFLLEDINSISQALGLPLARLIESEAAA
jgi:transcriptional regulator with XRE-family HTH domain